LGGAFFFDVVFLVVLVVGFFFDVAGFAFGAAPASP